MRAGLAALLALALTQAQATRPAHAASEPCSFRSRTLTISVPALQPDQAGDIQATAAGFEVGDCVPALLLQVRLDDGRHAAGGRRRMKHATQEAYLPYALSWNLPGAGSLGQPQPLRGPGRDRYLRMGLRLHLQGAALADLPAGDYSDSIILTVTP